MALHIESELGTQLPLAPLTRSGTPSKLIHAIELILESAAATVVPDDDARRLPLVFFMPHADGDTPSLAELRAIMKDHVRFVVIRYPQLSDIVGGGGGFDQLVDAAEAQVLAQSGEEPCLLIGFSFGGFVAWETARRLTEAGRRVAFLGLVDSRLVEPPRRFVARARRLFYLEWWRSGCLRRVARSLASSSPLSMLRQIDRLGMLLPVKAAFRFRHELVSQLRATSLRKDLLEPLEVPTTLFR